MSINNIIIYIMLAFLIFAVVDKLFLANRFGYGEKFDDAFNAMGPLALSIVGIMCMAPVLGNLLTPIITPVFQLIGADPAMFAGSLLASDMGGFSLAQQMTDNPDIIGLSGILLGSTMGVTIIFTIPYTSTIVKKEDQPYLSKGIMAGIIPIPVGCFIGGIIAGIPVKTLIVNLIPVTILAVLLAFLLWRAPSLTVRIFQVFAKAVTVFIGISLAVAIVDALTGYTLGERLFGRETLVPGMAPLEEQFITVGMIAAMLAGAYPFIHFLTTIFTKPLTSLGKLLGVNEFTVAGMLASLANSIPMYSMIEEMDDRGKVVAVSFSVCAGFCLGDILGYTSAKAPEFIFPMIVGKLFSGILAILVGVLLGGKGKSDKRISLNEKKDQNSISMSNV